MIAPLLRVVVSAAWLWASAFAVSLRVVSWIVGAPPWLDWSVAFVVGFGLASVVGELRRDDL